MTVEEVLAWLNPWLDQLIAKKDYLSDLDQKIGDGDHGNNMARGAKAVQESLAANTPDNVSDLFKQVAMQLMSKVGGAAGPLYGSAFLGMAQNGSEDYGELFSAGLDKIKARGKSDEGEKTMIDVWAPCAQALADKQLDQATIDQALATVKDLKATKGRASYYGDRSIGEMDPGAQSSAYLFEAILNK
ncbi:dihydroxyacetone kinase [Aerococcus urinaehominis]|uniref:phosphoenolpyruvate--glycerone phosphotransferase n=1 Tax=Aerococcus urinaehominis TaxID=128944 RepID=A0A0X8FMC5_9LACT|nr:dihydroxyacetone kinase subunit DhaL [Aerococcus urinaehominis]AMB99307.1 dihydroxyacetone kinase [Aerococcus urinaehominis]SDM19710.1 dihydroxyacetone kinase DhaL subunit [Aerococcus urinaehominis]